MSQSSSSPLSPAPCWACRSPADSAPLGCIGARLGALGETCTTVLCGGSTSKPQSPRRLHGRHCTRQGANYLIKVSGGSVYIGRSTVLGRCTASAPQHIGMRLRSPVCCSVPPATRSEARQAGRSMHVHKHCTVRARYDGAGSHLLRLQSCEAAAAREGLVAGRPFERGVGRRAGPKLERQQSAARGLRQVGVLLLRAQAHQHAANPARTQMRPGPGPPTGILAPIQLHGAMPHIHVLLNALQVSICQYPR
jgi:hypothetical protein